MEATAIPSQKTHSREHGLEQVQRRIAARHHYWRSRESARSAIYEKPNLTDLRNATLLANSCYQAGQISEETLKTFIEVLIASFVQFYVEDSLSSCVNERLNDVRNILIRQVME